MNRTKEEALEEFKKLAEDPVGKIYVDRFEDNVRVLIMRGPAALCAYLGIPAEHPLADNSYDDLTMSCHGGLTFASPGKKGGNGAEWPEGYFWYGWDYAHCDDACFYDLRPGFEMGRDDKMWGVKDVEGEIWSAVYDLKKLMKIAENAFAKGAGWRGKHA